MKTSSGSLSSQHPSTSSGNGSSLSISSGAAGNGSSAESSSVSSFKLLLLVLMVLQNSATVLVGRYTQTAVQDKSELYDINHLILVIELGKFILSGIFEFHTTQGKLIQSFRVHVLQRPLDSLKILVPALLYLVQNTLLYVALSNLTAPIFQVTYQAKLVTTAIVSVLLLKRTYNVQQWICLVALSLGVAIVVLGEKKSSGSGRRLAEAVTGAQNLFLGLTAVSIACFSSALAGVYFEMVLKVPTADATKQAPASLWMRNIQLSFFSIIIALGQGLMKRAPDTPVSYLHGFTTWTWVLVLLQAGGGLLVAAVIKYADNVLKGLATGVSVVFATLLSVVFFGTPLSNQFTFGATLILAAVYYFSNPLPACIASAFSSSGVKDKTEHDMVETKSLLPK
jgi:solute carrier family 35 (UDP-sugar transporter), member A1/2/3